MKHSIITDQIGEDFERALVEAKQLKFDAVEIHSLWGKSIETLDESEVSEMVRLIKRHEINVSSISSTLFLMCPLYTSVEHLEPFSDTFPVYVGSYAQHLSVLDAMLELAKRLDAPCIRVFPFRREDGVSKNACEIIEDIADRLRGPAERARQAGRVIAVENCPHSYLAQGRHTYELVKKVDNPGCGMLWDVGNSFKNQIKAGNRRPDEVDMTREFLEISDAVAHVHLKDYALDSETIKHVRLGAGDAGYSSILKAMNTVGFEGYASLEPEVPQEGVGPSAKWFLDELAREQL